MRISSPTTGTARKALICALKPGVDTFAMLLAITFCRFKAASIPEAAM